MEVHLKSQTWPHKRFELFLRVLMAVIAAHYIVVNGTDYNIFKLLLDTGYLKEMAFSISVSIILINWINFVTIKLDHRYGWKNYILERGILQFLLGVIIPSLMEFFLIAAYFYLLAGISVLDTPFMRNEFRIVVVLICFFNLYCITRYFYFRLQKTEEILESYIKKEETEHFLQEHTILPNEENNNREVFIVNTPLRSIPIRMDDICSFYRSNGCCYLRTYDQSVNDAYVIPQMLKEIEAIVDPLRFFRINRQMIVSFKSCISYRQGNGKTIELIIEPNYVDGEDSMKELAFVTVSAERVQAFKTWLDR